MLSLESSHGAHEQLGTTGDVSTTVCTGWTRSPSELKPCSEDVQQVAQEFFVAGADGGNDSGKPERVEAFARTDDLLDCLV